MSKNSPLTRRQALGWGALGAAGLLAGLEGLKRGWTRLEFTPEFRVRIYSPEQAQTQKLTEQQKKLIERSNLYGGPYLNGFIEVGFHSFDHYVEVDIYKWSTLLGRNVHRLEDFPITARTDGRVTFNYVLDNGRKVKVKQRFLTNRDLLAKLVEADRVKGTDQRFPSFYADEERDYYGHKVPTSFLMWEKGSNVCYYVDGPEVLTEGNKRLFAEYWSRRNDFPDFETSITEYDKMYEAAERAESVSESK